MTATTPYFRPVLSRSPGAVAASVRTSLSDPLRGELLRMLREAPGFACDIAFSLERDLATVQTALDSLADSELVIAVPEGGDYWYTLSTDQVAAWLDSIHAASQPETRAGSRAGGPAGAKP